MSWNTFVFGYNSYDEKGNILEMCKEYNNTTSPKLEGFQESWFKKGKQYKPRGIFRTIAQCDRVISCGSYGGRDFIRKYFNENNMHCYALDSGMKRRLCTFIPINLETGELEITAEMTPPPPIVDNETHVKKVSFDELHAEPYDYEEEDIKTIVEIEIAAIPLPTRTYVRTTNGISLFDPSKWCECSDISDEE
tara:strand:+ start:66 stop:644 length:579 start_codon:yes stop_codon:yes gene_type:complete